MQRRTVLQSEQASTQVRPEPDTPIPAPIRHWPVGGRLPYGKNWRELSPLEVQSIASRNAASIPNLRALLSAQHSP